MHGDVHVHQPSARGVLAPLAFVGTRPCRLSQRAAHPPAAPIADRATIRPHGLFKDSRRVRSHQQRKHMPNRMSLPGRSSWLAEKADPGPQHSRSAIKTSGSPDSGPVITTAIASRLQQQRYKRSTLQQARQRQPRQNQAGRRKTAIKDIEIRLLCRGQTQRCRTCRLLVRFRAGIRLQGRTRKHLKACTVVVFSSRDVFLPQE